MTYIQAIGTGFPTVQCHIVGEGDIYENLIWDSGSPLPDKLTLDQWISSNANTLTGKRKITVLAFRNRFTKTEKINIDLASIDPGSSATLQERSIAAAIRVDSKDTDNATFIDLDRPDTRAGVIALETYRLISEGRALIILDSPIQDMEFYIK